jgi:hypothetical protein
LGHLLDVGPILWSTLYNHFGPGKTDELVLALRDLIEWQYVDLGQTNIVEVTDLGKSPLLKNGNEAP